MTTATVTDGPEPGQVPGGWHGSEMAKATGSWQVAVPAEVREDLLSAAAGLPAGDVAADPFQRPPEVSARTRSLAAGLHARLAGDPGFVVLTGFPVHPELTRAAYWLLALLVGQPLLQGWEGELVSAVESVGRNARVPGVQGNRMPGALPFHVDRCTDLVGLLCVRAARSGGLSRLISCKKVHNTLLAEYPDLLTALYQPLPFTLPPFRDEDERETVTWCGIPVFSRAGDHFAAYYLRRLIEETQLLDDAPRLTGPQKAALDAIDEIMNRPEMPLEMPLRPGDVQLINNMHVLHSRTAYHDDADRKNGRLLLRIHLAFAGSPALPDSFATLFGATEAGTYRGGIWRTARIRERLGMPLEPAGAR